MNSIHIGNKIKEFLETQEEELTNAAEKLDITYTALFPIFKKEDVNTKLLRKLSEVYGVPMSLFLTTSNNAKAYKMIEPSTDYGNSKIEVLEAEKRGLEKEIELLREMVEILKNGK